MTNVPPDDRPVKPSCHLDLGGPRHDEIGVRESYQALALPGQAAYVPYFWDTYLLGGADSEADGVVSFEVTDVDRECFPELTGRQLVRLSRQDDGSVFEVS